MAEDKRGQVITFYSYRGGTGRSTAAQIVACMLAKRCQPGKGVLIVDWDLQGPTQHGSFQNLVTTQFQGSPDPSEAYREHSGLFDLFVELNRRVYAPKYADPQSEEAAAELLKEVGPERFIIKTDIPNLHLLKAGCLDKEFYNRILSFDWEDFYNRSPWMMTKLAEWWGQTYEYVLIDSTPGMSDISGICTMIMPEKIVFMVSPNQSNLEGGLRMLRSATSYRRESSDLRPLVIYPLPSRMDLRDPKEYEQWRFTYAGELERLFREVYGFSSCNLDAYLSEVLVPETELLQYGEITDWLKTSGDPAVPGYPAFVRWLESDKNPWG